MARHTKQCFCCGNEYSYCPTCFEDRLKPSWYSMFDSESCKELNAILSAHTCGKMDDKTAKEQIEKLNIDLSTIKNELNKEYIEKLLAKKATKKTVEKNDNTEE